MQHRDPTVSILWPSLSHYFSPSLDFEASFYFRGLVCIFETLRPWSYANNCHLTFNKHKWRHNHIWELLLKSIIVTYIVSNEVYFRRMYEKDGLTSDTIVKILP